MVFITRAPRLLTAVSLVDRTFNPRTVHLHELLSGTLLQMGLTGKYLAVVLLLLPGIMRGSYIASEFIYRAY